MLLNYNFNPNLFSFGKMAYKGKIKNSIKVSYLKII